MVFLSEIVVPKFIMFTIVSAVSNSEVLVKKLCCLSEIVFSIAHIFIIPFSTLCSATWLALLLFCSDLFIITIIIIAEQ